MKDRFLLLGTGSSLGVPIVGCSCQVCGSDNPKNKRLRSSALVQIGEKRLLLDAGPDIRHQALKYGVSKIDGFLLTHAHYDHLGGFDDLKIYQYLADRKLPCLMSRDTFDEFRIRYHYFVKCMEENLYESPYFSWHFLEHDFGKTEFQGIEMEYVTYYQMGMKVIGLKIGNLAYISDIKVYSEDLVRQIKGVDILIVSALRHTTSVMHFSLEEAIEFSKKIEAKKTILTHISHELDHDATNALLPDWIEMGYDGMEIVFQSSKFG
jgi:phosphoribosyl 1,2-cyclic phosphate phosphodiesterase